MHKIYCQLKNIFLYKFFNFSYSPDCGDGDNYLSNCSGNGYGFGYGFKEYYGPPNGYYWGSGSENGNGSYSPFDYDCGCGSGYSDGNGSNTIKNVNFFLEEDSYA